MRIVRLEGSGRRLSAPPGVERAVAEIVAQVRGRGDDALLELTARLDRVELSREELRVPPSELEAALRALEPSLLHGLRTTVANVGAVARAGLRDAVAVELPEGQRVQLAEVPVRRVGAYVPGGRAPYPSTVAMCAVTARVAGVEEVAVCAPPGPGGEVHAAILAACALCELDEVYRLGGAQAIAALALGTETVPRVDVIAGPGNAYVREAKRQLAGAVGMDGLAGPSELAVVATAGADPELAALDLLAQAEHGPDSLLWALSPDPSLLDAVAAALPPLAAERPSAADAELQLVRVADARAAVRAADAIAPEHLQLMGAEAEALAGEVRAAGCVFVGAGSGTAFGDYVAGSNHVLPTGGAARFGSALSTASFRRRMARVSLPDRSPARLAPAGAAVARAEGFPVHAESMERRA